MSSPRLALALVLFAGCTPKIQVADRFVESLASGGPVSLKSITPFSWDVVYIFPPYTPGQEIQRLTGAEPSSMKDIETRDDICLLVFMQSGRFLQTIEIPRSRADLGQLKAPGGLQPGQAVFVLRGSVVTLATAP
jgi:hypothetical protein